MATRKTTSSRKTTTTTKSTAGSSAAKAAAAPAPEAQDEVVPAPAPAATGGLNAVRKKELFTRVKARSKGVKGQDVRVVLDAVLEELGDLLVEGNALNVRPLGVVKVQKRRELSGANVVICKLRRKKPVDGEKDPLAEAAE